MLLPETGIAWNAGEGEGPAVAADTASGFRALKRQRFRAAVETVRRHADFIMDTRGVVATGTGVGPDGLAVVKVFTTGGDAGYIPDSLDDVPVTVEVRGRFYARDTAAGQLDTVDRWPRPVPIGISAGHPGVTAGTIGARVTDGVTVYALSNNHVFADLNRAMIGDEILQPGPIDGGSGPTDVIGDLADYGRIELCDQGQSPPVCPANRYDGAIAEVIDPVTRESNLGYATPGDGYGVPGADLHPAYGDPDVLFDDDENLEDLIGTGVQKYGRSTGLTNGTVEAVFATVDVCYNSSCSRMARFVDQIVISPGSFSDPGDSGSLIVTRTSAKKPVGLLFAGNNTSTIANRIDRVLIGLGVSIDQPPSVLEDQAGIQLFGRKPESVGDGWYAVAFPSTQPDPLVVLAAMETTLGANPAGTRIRNLNQNGFQIRIEEEQSKDDETRHTEEGIGYLVLRPGRIINGSGQTVGEARIVSKGQASGDQWHRLTYAYSTYPAPVAIANLLTVNGRAPCHVRLRNVTSVSLEYQIEEWNYLNQKHTDESIAFLIMKGGSHSFSGGRRMEAGTLEVDHDWAGHSFSTGFTKAPVSLSQPQTYNGRSAIVTRMDAVTNRGFQVRIQEEERANGRHRPEVVGYVAVDG